MGNVGSVLLREWLTDTTTLSWSQWLYEKYTVICFMDNYYFDGDESYYHFLLQVPLNQ